MTVQENIQQLAYEQLFKDAQEIRQLIRVQIEHVTMPQCPLYEEVIDTQMFGLSKKIEFATKLGLIEESKGKALLDNLEKELSELHGKYLNQL